MIKRIFTGNYTDCQAGNLISISGDKGKSVGFEGKSLTRLAPKRAFWNEWHNNIGKIPEEENTKFYIQEYYKQVLSQVDIEELVKDEKDPILLCYERGQDFCHRHVLAEFINIRYGINVEDLIIDKNLNISINKRPENVKKILEEVLIEQLPYINDEVLKKKVESMIEIGRKYNLSDNELKDLFVLGFNHDIGYEFIDNLKHAQMGGEILKRNNYKY